MLGKIFSLEKFFFICSIIIHKSQQQLFFFFYFDVIFKFNADKIQPIFKGISLFNVENILFWLFFLYFDFVIVFIYLYKKYLK